jgi:tRNA threonylcarbamoyl adenosine modification protein (Sua5/YciO/YrdC/YwlC family)
MDALFPSISDKSVREKARDVLEAGGVLVLPTDTLHGLSAAVTSLQAVMRIAAIKGAASRTQFLLLADSIKMVERYVESFGCSGHDSLARLWPAPVTVILPAGDRCPDWLGDTVAFRVPDYPPLREVIRHLGVPVISTSINRSGEPPILDLGEIKNSFGDLVDMFVAGEVNTNLASTIVDLSGDRPEVVRQGDYVWGESG